MNKFDDVTHIHKLLLIFKFDSNLCIIFMNKNSEQFRFPVSSGFFMQELIWQLYIYLAKKCRYLPSTIYNRWEMGAPWLSFCSKCSKRNKLFIELECSLRAVDRSGMVPVSSSIINNQGQSRKTIRFPEHKFQLNNVQL